MQIQIKDYEIRADPDFHGLNNKFFLPDKSKEKIVFW